MKRRIVAVVLALVLALVGFGLVFSYVHGADARAVESQHPVTAFVVKKLVPAGTSLEQAQSQGLIAATKVAQSGRPAGVLDAVDATNQSLVATTDIQPGEFVMSARFGTSPVSQKAIGVPNGKVAIAVQLTDPQRVGQFITPGSHIVIYATHSIKRLGVSEEDKAFNQLGLTGTHVVLADVEVIAFGTKPLQNPSNGNSASNAKGSDSTGNSNNNATAYLVTVAVSPTESVRLVHAVNDYTLYAGLLGSGTKVSPSGEADDGNVFGGKSVMGGVK
ncbi:RcpC/CpaB family pilus assembly protein [Flexivirga alba]|uniref:RcpC/CpaB family pilus assembly protein n=1 Tax=Flexivirga alba TaxID=702742 RepID=A0ABW2AAX1_9MICO